MVDALPLRSVWVGRPPRRLQPLDWWLTAAMLVLNSAALAVAVVWILRVGL
jgi:hypothetical protein